MGQQLYDVYRPTFLEFLQPVYKLTDFSEEFASVLTNCGRTKKDQSGVAIMLQIGLPQVHDSNVDQDRISPLEASVLFSVSPPNQRDMTSYW
jgi:hypothetical protein